MLYDIVSLLGLIITVYRNVEKLQVYLYWRMEPGVQNFRVSFNYSHGSH